MWGYHLIPSKADFKQTSGIFGSWNNDVNDDLKYLKGTTTIASSLPIFHNSFEYIKILLIHVLYTLMIVR
jgi:hypothetical protein